MVIDKMGSKPANIEMKLTRLSIDRLLFGEVWAFGPADTEDRWGRMVFLSYGRTFGYHNPNEFGWDFKSGALRLKNQDGEPTSIYDKLVVHDGRPRLVGKSLLSPGSMFCLERIDLENW